MGAMFGTAFELFVNSLFPGIASPPGAYALVGMAALFAATAHAPLTAVLILFELTGDYKIMLPLMLTVVIATLFAQKLLKGESIYTLKLTRRGVRLQHGRDIDVLQGVLVNEVVTRDVNTITYNMDLKELSRVFDQTRHHGIAVLDRQGKLWGLVTISDLERAVNNGMPLSQTRVSEIGTTHQNLVFAYPEETIGDALNKMSQRGFGRLPVVSKEDPSHLIGIIQRRDIIEAYQIALTKRAEIQQRTARIKVRNIDGTEFLDLEIASSSPVIGKPVSEIAPLLPPECILVSIRRNGKILIPNGNTVILAGDKLTAFARSADVENVYQVFFSQQTAKS
jgi:CIC family chloride channel protein